MRLVFLAPPGGGKGTQGNIIKQKYGILPVSTGELLRDHKSRRTKLGKNARFYMDSGELVPDELITEMLKEEICRDKYSNGFLLDGFPRTKVQAGMLDEILTDMQISLDAVIVLEVPKAELIGRLSARRVCKTCSKVYHLIYNPPEVQNHCNSPCCGRLYQRDDDRKETIINRLKIYDSKADELIEYYKPAGIVHIIDGVGEVDEVCERIDSVLMNIMVPVQVNE
ncbi:MAG: adenylate kinase [Candidatus Kapaibacterium sp.]|jgi:adenylate kinase|nr:adenylate kinase [Candidatus Kapabacteria bacterium]